MRNQVLIQIAVMSGLNSKEILESFGYSCEFIVNKRNVEGIKTLEEIEKLLMPKFYKTTIIGVDHG